MQQTLRSRRLPADDEDCGWWETLPAPSAAHKVTSEERAESVVIGAGFTGLAIARQLARHHPDRRFILVEAQRVGFGSAGRNSGFVGDLFHRGPATSAEENRRMKRISRLGCEQLRELAQAHRIDCQWSDAGHMHVATSKLARRSLLHLTELMARFEEPHKPLDAEQVRSVIGVDYYRAGIYLPETTLVQPAALARGLGENLPENVDLFEESPVVEIQRGSPFRIRAGAGSIVADRVFFAINAYMRTLGLYKRRMFPLYTFGSLTRPLTAEEQAELGGANEWGFRSEDLMGPTIRRTHDQRILFRNRIRYGGSFWISPKTLARIRLSHREGLDRRFPMLRGVEFQHTWGGVMGNTMNDGQIFGRLDDNLYASVAYNGCGVAMGTGAGTLLADYAKGENSELVSEALQLKNPAWLPWEPFLGIGVRAYTGYLYRRAGPER